MEDPSLDAAVQALLDFLQRGRLPSELPDRLAKDPQFLELVSSLNDLRQFSLALSKGDLSPAIRSNGPLAGSLKNLQASLRRLTWQAQKVVDGDFSQRAEFMGEFSAAFNEMVARLETGCAQLHQREDELSSLNASLEKEISERKRIESVVAERMHFETLLANLSAAFAMLQPGEVEIALQRSLHQIVEFLDADRGSLVELSPDRTRSYFLSSYARPGIPPAPTAAAFDEWRAWNERMDQGEILLVNHRTDQDRDGALLQKMALAGEIKSYLAIPLSVGRATFGFLVFLAFQREQSWSQELLPRLKLIGEIFANAVARQRAESAEHEQRILAETLLNTATALNSTLDFNQVLKQILANIERVVPLDTANICLIDSRNVMNFVLFYGYAERGLPEEPYTSELITLDKVNNLRQIFETGEPMIISDTQSDPDWIKVESSRWIRSYAGMPIRVRGHVVGFLNLNSSVPGFYKDEHIQRLRFFADQAAVAIENARLFTDVNRRVDELKVINRIGQGVLSGLDLEQVLRTLSEQCRQILPVDVLYVAVYDPETGYIHHPLLYEQGHYSYTQGARDIRTIPGLGGEVIMRRETLYVSDLLTTKTTHARQVTRPLGKPTRSYVGVPLIVQDRLVGILSMQSYQPNAYSTDQIRLLEIISTQAAIAIEKARLFEQMRQLATTDSLTQLHTRRHFFDLARKEIERSGRFKHPLAAIMLDLDNFKQINDTYGHAAGDQVLQSLARQCLRSLRTIDIIGRYGGEEFMVILPETDGEAGRVVAERLREAVAAMEILTPRGVIRLTISLGVSALEPDHPDLETLLDRADQALLQAKRSGRNRTMVFK